MGLARRLSAFAARASLAAKCLILVAAVRLGLTFLSYNVVKRWTPRAPMRLADEGKLKRTAWGVARAATLVPRASCLTQALAAQIILARSGYHSDIRIGVRRDDKGAVSAHAWLMSGERIVLGGETHELSDFAILTQLGPQAS